MNCNFLLSKDTELTPYQMGLKFNVTNALTILGILPEKCEIADVNRELSKILIVSVSTYGDMQVFYCPSGDIENDVFLFSFSTHMNIDSDGNANLSLSVKHSPAVTEKFIMQKTIL